MLPPKPGTHQHPGRAPGGNTARGRAGAEQRTMQVQPPQDQKSAVGGGSGGPRRAGPAGAAAGNGRLISHAGIELSAGGNRAGGRDTVDEQPVEEQDSSSVWSQALHHHLVGYGAVLPAAWLLLALLWQLTHGRATVHKRGMYRVVGSEP